ncbi:MAG: ammonium transporter [Termitinemataceae bacterium]|nr:MAG: ammonium transporter [Termitinemataceae bacterium]
MESVNSIAFSLDTLWLFLGAILVFIMQAGFALVETGLTRAKNATNITMKNVMDLCFGAIAYWLVGWALMYGKDALGGLVGSSDFLRGPMTIDEDSAGFYRTWFFQVVFAATAATIVSGAMAERTQFKSYLIYTVFISAIIYPISGHWVWSPDGWLAKLGFHDFAGSTVVHSVGGWAALIGAFIVGPRIGKYVKGENGKVSVKALPGHNIPFVALGVFLLWFGWFGFNGASTGVAVAGEGGVWSGLNIAHVCVTTLLAACAGGIGALVTSWVWFKKPDCSMTLNGTLAGLVSITAGCAVVSPGASIIIGLLGGCIVVWAVEFIDKTLHIDDPVGASSVHLACGIWGTIAVGLWGNVPDVALGLFYGGGFNQLVIQLIGVGSVAAWTVVTSLILFIAIKATLGLRVSPKEEKMGLDISEHKSESYSGFQIFSNS